MLGNSGFEIASVRSKLASLALFLVGISSVAASAAPHEIDRRHFEIVGLTLFKDEMIDVERQLGPATVYHERGSDFPERCYASTGEARTVLVLEDWTGTLVGFRISRESPETIEKCTRTPAVSPQISTLGGLMLGLTKSDVLKLLGTPTKTTRNSIVYLEDVKSRANEKEALWEYTEVDIEFANSKAISIHIVH